MSNPQADQLKPLLQRLLTMAESHDERLARLEAAHSRLGTQIARVGEQLSRQGDQLSRLEDAPTVAPVLAPVPVSAPLPARAGGAEANSRFGEQFGRLNEQITRVREHFGRMTEQLGRIERAQTELREDSLHHGSEQQRLLERLEVALIRRQDELAADLPERIQDRMEQVLGFVVAEGGEEELGSTSAHEPPTVEVKAVPVPVQTSAPVQAPVQAQTPAPSAPSAHLASVQDEVRQLGERLAELMAHVGKLGGAQSTPAPVVAPAQPAPAPVSAVAPAPVADPEPAPVAAPAAAPPVAKPVVARPVVVRVMPGSRLASR